MCLVLVQFKLYFIKILVLLKYVELHSKHLGSRFSEALQDKRTKLWH